MVQGIKTSNIHDVITDMVIIATSLPMFVVAAITNFGVIVGSVGISCQEMYSPVMDFS